MWKDFDYPAKRLVPIGEQIGISYREKAEMMKSKTRRFSAEDIGNSGRNEWQKYDRYGLSSATKLYWHLRTHSYLFRVTPSHFDFLLYGYRLIITLNNMVHTSLTMSTGILSIVKRL